MLTDKERRWKLGLHHLDHPEQTLEDWALEENIHCGVAYIGAWGIVEALRAAADMVICGRVIDASPIIAAAAWWYYWGLELFN